VITLTREEAQQVLECMETAIKAGDWVVDGACDPDFILYMLRHKLIAPDVMINGLTEQETAETMSVKGLAQPEPEPIPGSGL